MTRYLLGRMEKMWVEDDERAVGGTKGGVRKPSGKGSRLIILHAGCEQGWIDGAALVFQSKKQAIAAEGSASESDPLGSGSNGLK